jgi:hypothetical protein
MPNTPAGRTATRYLAAFNSGDARTMQAFIEAAFLPNPSRPMDERLKSYSTLFADQGPLALASIDSSTATKITLGVRAKRGPLFVTLKLFDADSAHVESITVAAPGPHR